MHIKKTKPSEEGFTITDTPHSVGHLWTSGRTVAETSTWQHTTFTQDGQTRPWGIRTRNPRKRAVTDPSLRSRGHRDGRWLLLVILNINPPTTPSVVPQPLPANWHTIDYNGLLHYSSATISFNNVGPIRIACIVLFWIWWSEMYRYTYAFNLYPFSSPNSQCTDIHQGMRQPDTRV